MRRVSVRVCEQHGAGNTQISDARQLSRQLKNGSQTVKLSRFAQLEELHNVRPCAKVQSARDSRGAQFAIAILPQFFA